MLPLMPVKVGPTVQCRERRRYFMSSLNRGSCWSFISQCQWYNPRACGRLPAVNSTTKMLEADNRTVSLMSPCCRTDGVCPQNLLATKRLDVSATVVRRGDWILKQRDITRRVYAVKTVRTRWEHRWTRDEHGMNISWTLANTCWNGRKPFGEHRMKMAWTLWEHRWTRAWLAWSEHDVNVGFDPPRSIDYTDCGVKLPARNYLTAWSTAWTGPQLLRDAILRPRL